LEKQLSKTEAEASTISHKDILTLTLSAIALLVALVGAWFQFFRNEAHLRITVADGTQSIDKTVSNFRGLDIQTYDDVYNVGLLNDGNKDVLVTSMTRSMYVVDDVKKEEDLPHGVFATVQLRANVSPQCPKSGAGEFLWQSYDHDEKNAQQGVAVVRADQFFTLNRLKFAGFFLPRELAAKGQTTQILICFKISFVKPNGKEGVNSVPVALLSVKRDEGSPDAVDRLIHAGTTTFSGLQSVDN
jgi:hypothetical protein